jgi:hypothetical protein
MEWFGKMGLLILGNHDRSMKSKHQWPSGGHLVDVGTLAIIVQEVIAITPATRSDNSYFHIAKSPNLHKT